MFLLPEEHQRTYRSIVFIWLLATHLVGLEKGVKWKSLSWIFHRKKERTVKQSDCVRSLLFDAEHRRFPCINVASKQAPYCSFSPYSTQWKFKLLNWIAAVQVRLRSHVSFSLLSVWVQSFVKKTKKKIQCAVYSSLWLQHTVISLLYRCLKTVWIWLYESAFSQREAPSAALS